MNLMEKKKYVEENIGFVPQDVLDSYTEEFAYFLAKNSSSIEGESVTLAQVMAIVKGNKNADDSNLNRAAYNHFHAFYMVKERASKNEPLTEDFLKDVHERLLSGLINGGLYRNVDIKIKGSNHTPCSYLKVYDRMSKFFYDIENFDGSDLEKVAYTHLQIAKIHPFLDGNGRLARLMMNYQLIKLGYLPISISAKDRQNYFNTLEEFKVNKTSVPFIEMITRILDKEYDRFINVIKKYVK